MNAVMSDRSCTVLIPGNPTLKKRESESKLPS